MSGSRIHVASKSSDKNCSEGKAPTTSDSHHLVIWEEANARVVLFTAINAVLQRRVQKQEQEQCPFSIQVSRTATKRAILNEDERSMDGGDRDDDDVRVRVPPLPPTPYIRYPLIPLRLPCLANAVYEYEMCCLFARSLHERNAILGRTCMGWPI